MENTSLAAEIVPSEVDQPFPKKHQAYSALHKVKPCVT